MTLALALLVCLAALGLAAVHNDSPTVTKSDSPDNELTRIEIGGPIAGAAPISPRVFSNFLEHLGGTIYDGLWANTVHNPQFAPDKQGRLVRWKLSRKESWQKEGGVEGRCLVLTSGDMASQLITLPVHRTRQFVGSVWFQSDSPAVVDISLRRSDKPAVIAANRFNFGKSGWSRHAFTLVVPEGALRKAEPTELVVQAVEGDVRVDMLELFPNDHAGGVDPDVSRLTKALHIELLRWPGGNFVSGYDWRNGIGPREKRPTLPNPAWAGLETHHFGTDEFMAFCARVGAKPQICVNAGDGKPEDAAAWVQYCNGGPGTPMGGLRAQNGHPKPYNVRVWEIGNELYGDWQIGHTDPKGNAERFVRFRDAMLAADPTIEIIATGKGDEFVGEGLQRTRDWNHALLKTAASGGRHPDYLSLHPIVPLPADLNRKYTYDEVYYSTMAHPKWWSDTYAPELRTEAQAVFGPSTHLKLAPTEWGLIIGGPNWPRYPNHDVQSGAVYAALFFHAMFRQSGFVGLANVTALMHGGGIKRPSSITFVDPMYHVERMYGVARPERLLATTVQGPEYSVPERGILPGVQNVPYLDVIAALDKSGQRLIFVVNRSAKESRAAELHLATSAASAEIETVAASPQQGNSLQQPNSVAPVSSRVKVGGKTFTHSFPACSVSVIKLK